MCVRDPGEDVADDAAPAPVEDPLLQQVEDLAVLVVHLVQVGRDQQAQLPGADHVAGLQRAQVPV